MKENLDQVYLFVFKNGDGMDTDAKIEIATSEYVKEKRPELQSVFHQNFSIARTERGKPYLPNFPYLYFSVSHSGEYCVCAVSDFPVGVDLQTHDRLKNETEEDGFRRLQSIAKRFFHPTEVSYLLKKDEAWRFYLLWTARESYVKLTGGGIDDHFSQWCVLPEEMSLQPVSTGETPCLWRAMGHCFLAMRFRETYTLCVCTDREASLRTVFLK